MNMQEHARLALRALVFECEERHGPFKTRRDRDGVGLLITYGGRPLLLYGNEIHWFEAFGTRWDRPEFYALYAVIEMESGVLVPHHKGATKFVPLIGPLGLAALRAHLTATNPIA